MDIKHTTGHKVLMASTQVSASGNTKVASLASPKLYDVEMFIEGLCILNATAVEGTSPTIDCDIISYDEKSTAWGVIGSFSQVTGANYATPKVLKLDSCLGKTLAIQYVLGGTSTPKVTFSVTCIAKT
jgi:hypothetical protein